MEVNPPRPFAFTIEEGGTWEPFKPGQPNGLAEFSGLGGRPRYFLHAVLFDDGSVFDTYNGWRPERKDEDQMADLWVAFSERRGKRVYKPFQGWRKAKKKGKYD